MAYRKRLWPTPDDWGWLNLTESGWPVPSIYQFRPIQNDSYQLGSIHNNWYQVQWGNNITGIQVDACCGVWLLLRDSTWCYLGLVSLCRGDVNDVMPMEALAWHTISSFLAWDEIGDKIRCWGGPMCTSAKPSSTYFNLFSHQPNTTGFPTVNGGSTYKSWGHNL